MKVHVLFPCRRTHQGGSALVVSLAVLGVMSGLVLAYLAIAVDSAEWTDHQAEERRVELAAQVAIDLAVDDLWGSFERQNVNIRTTPWTFRTYLEGLGLENQAGTTDPVRFDMRARVELPTHKSSNWLVHDGPTKAIGKSGGSKLSDPVQTDQVTGVDIDRLDVWREDFGGRTQLFFEVSAASGALTKTIREAFVIERPTWEGLDFALLANNINCLMCHTEVDNVERVYNKNPNMLGTFEKVKLGSLESFQLREDPESWFAGTLFLAGHGLDEDGKKINNWANISFKSRDYDIAGYLIEDAFGDLHETDLDPKLPVDEDPYANLYTDYLSGDPIAGYLPSEFPSPFPDDGGIDPVTGDNVPENADNRTLDDSEFAAKAATAGGTIAGGIIHVADPASKIDKQNELEQLENHSTTELLPGVTEGHVYLHGKKNDPIILEGDIAIDGDLIIHGYVKGSGSIWASGNVYMPSDLVYADAEDANKDRIFGQAADGSPNALAVAAGQNIMVGNVFTPAWGEGDPTNGWKSGSFNFIMDELALFNRTEWMKTQTTLPGKTQKVKVGTKTVEVTKWKKKKVQTNPGAPAGYEKYKWVKYGQPWTETVTKNVYDYSTPQLENPYYAGPEYIPRYYNFTEDSIVPIFNKKGYLDPGTGLWVADERVGKWSSSRLTYAYPAKANDDILYNNDGSPKAVVSTLTASGGWMSDAMLMRMMEEWLKKRPKKKDPLEIDATLYSNNSIFGIIPTHAVGLDGKLLVNGGIVAADVGLLAPKGMQLNYDARGKTLLNISGEGRLNIRRQLRIPIAAN